MGNSMKKFKKLAALAITIPTLLSSTNISFAMKSNRQQSAFSPSSSDNYEIIYSSQSQEEDIYTSSKPIKPPAEDKKGKKGKKSRIEKSLECTNPKCPTYRNGEKCVKPFGDPHPRKDGKQMQRYRCARCNKYFTLDENGKVVKKELKDCILCNGKGCAVKNGIRHPRKDGIRMQQYKCKRCGQSFSQPTNKNAEEQAGIETQPN